MADKFWDKVKAQTEELRSARSADDVMRILSPERNPYGPDWGGNAGEGFFVSGLEDTMWDSLKAAGWKRVWTESPLYYVAKAPNGDLITYCEGDVDRGDPRSKAAKLPTEFSPTDLANPYNREAQEAKKEAQEQPVKAMTERQAYVTEQVALWIENDSKHNPDAVALAKADDVPALRRYLVKTIRFSRRGEAAWHVSRELAPNDFDRIRWDVVAERLVAE